VCGGHWPHEAMARGHGGTRGRVNATFRTTSCGNVVSGCSQSGRGGKPKYHSRNTTETAGEKRGVVGRHGAARYKSESDRNGGGDYHDSEEKNPVGLKGPPALSGDSPTVSPMPVGCVLLRFLAAAMPVMRPMTNKIKKITEMTMPTVTPA
jgi:hypothetical protein